MKKFIIACGLLIFVFTNLHLSAQEGNRGGRDMPADGTISGQVVDAKTKQPVEYANISIYSVRDSSLVTGGITNKKGFFTITGVRYGRYYGIAEFIGYTKFKIGNFVVKPDSKDVNLGEIKLDITVEMLDEAVVEAENARVEYKLDRKVITPDKDLNAAGGTAVDVLENTPSVQTDIDGNVSIRGSSNFLVMIDGRPSPIQGSEALQQIPAGTIQSIEIITNPSAKYDPDGVGGIINVILKKDKRQGINGLFSASYGSFNTLGGDFLVNMRTTNFNFFVGGNYNDRQNKGSSYGLQKTYVTDTLTVETVSSRNRGRTDGKLRAGFDYFINPNNVLTFSGYVGLDGMNSGSTDSIESYWIREGITDDYLKYYNVNDSKREGLYYSTDLNYQHKFKKQGHEITAYAYYDFDNDDENNHYTQYIVAGSPDEYRTLEISETQNLRGQVDYILPLFSAGKLEAGYQVKQRWSSNDYHYQLFDDSQWTDSLQNDYVFNQNIQSGYVTFSNETGKFGYMLGVRSEYTSRFFDQDEVLVPVNTHFTDFNIFPTLHLSYKLPWDMQAMSSYSRRVNRPMNYFLDPYPEVTDAYNIRQGNPMLEPEYTDAIELNLQKRFKSNFVSLEAFCRRTTNKFERVKVVSTDNPEIMISTFENIGKDLSAGLELTTNVNLTQWWNMNLSGDGYYYEIIAESGTNSASNNTFTWGARMNNTFKIKKTGTSFQLSGFLRGNSITSQGTSKGMGMVSVGFRQDFMKNKLSLTFNLRDIFGTMGHEELQETAQFYSFNSMKRKSPTFNITVTYRLNDYNRRKDKSGDREGEGGDEM